MRQLTVILILVLASGCTTMTRGEKRRAMMKEEIMNCAERFTDFNAEIISASRACMGIDAYVRKPASRRKR